MTVPPELWSRVIVIQWRQLLPLVPAAEQQLASDDPETCGKALEHLMICERQPVINSYARTPRRAFPCALARAKPISRGTRRTELPRALQSHTHVVDGPGISNIGLLHHLGTGYLPGRITLDYRTEIP
jgi:hypothetical protein